MLKVWTLNYGATSLKYEQIRPYFNETNIHTKTTNRKNIFQSHLPFYQEEERRTPGRTSQVFSERDQSHRFCSLHLNRSGFERKAVATLDEFALSMKRAQEN